MFSYILPILLSAASVHAIDVQSAHLSITFTGTIVPVQELVINMYPIDSAMSELFRIDTKHISSFGLSESSFLIVDLIGIIATTNLLISILEDNTLYITTSNADILVYNWPEGKDNQEVIAQFIEIKHKAIALRTRHKKIKY